MPRCEAGVALVMRAFEAARPLAADKLSGHVDGMIIDLEPGDLKLSALRRSKSYRPEEVARLG